MTEDEITSYPIIKINGVRYKRIEDREGCCYLVASPVPIWCNLCGIKTRYDGTYKSTHMGYYGSNIALCICVTCYEKSKECNCRNG